jgi:hypothetical protein
MALIPLTQGKFAIVDDKDFEWLSKWKWYYDSFLGYAKRYIKIQGKTRSIYLHSVINNTPKKLQTDHINRNKLDNRRCNLRSVTKNQNKFNTGLWRHNTSGYKGVSWHKSYKRWEVYIGVNNQKINLGYFFNLEDAYRCRLKNEKQYL